MILPLFETSAALRHGALTLHLGVSCGDPFLAAQFSRNFVSGGVTASDRKPWRSKRSGGFERPGGPKFLDHAIPERGGGREKLCVSGARWRARRQDQAPDASMKQFTRQQEQHVADISVEPIDRELKSCILSELFAHPDSRVHPGSRVVKRRGQLFFQRGRFEMLCERLCAARRRWRRSRIAGDGSNTKTRRP
jgi:hypothetical protein